MGTALNQDSLGKYVVNWDELEIPYDFISTNYDELFWKYEPKIYTYKYIIKSGSNNLSIYPADRMIVKRITLTKTTNNISVNDKVYLSNKRIGTPIDYLPLLPNRNKYNVNFLAPKGEELPFTIYKEGGRDEYLFIEIYGLIKRRAWPRDTNFHIDIYVDDELTKSRSAFVPGNKIYYFQPEIMDGYDCIETFPREQYLNHFLINETDPTIKGVRYEFKYYKREVEKK